MFPLFALHLLVFDLAPSFFFSMLFASPTALRYYFESTFLERSYPMTFACLSPLLIWVYLTLKAFPSVGAPPFIISHKSILLGLMSFLQRGLVLIVVAGLAGFEILILIVYPMEYRYLWYLILAQTYVVFLIVCLVLLNAELFLRSET